MDLNEKEVESKDISLMALKEGHHSATMAFSRRQSPSLSYI